MNILVGGFVAESNARVKKNTELNDFMIKTGEEVVRSLYIEDIFEEANINVIPAIYADGRGGGLVDKDAFDFICKKMIDAVKAHKYDIDGIFLFLHGASHVVDLEGGSGDLYILKEIRKVVGQYLPIAIVCDPHGNISQEQVDLSTILRTFRHSPHTDRQEAHRIVARLFLDLLNNRRNIKPEYRKVPIILGGERTVSTDEPMVSINKLLDKIEDDERILCCSYHIGYVRHDSDKCGACVVVVPNSEADQDYAAKQADYIAEYVFSKRHEFHFTGTALEPEESMMNCINFAGSPVYLTDSGDNTTAGAQGSNTYVLRQFLSLDNYNNKKILFAGIVDTNAVINILSNYKVGDEVSLDLGEELDELSKKVHIEGKIISQGRLVHHYGETVDMGECYTISLKDKPIDILIEEKAVSFAERAQYETANVNMDDYDITIVKQGYLYPELKARAAYFVMSLTDGSTNQRTERIKYRMILRPMYPIDEI